MLIAIGINECVMVVHDCTMDWAVASYATLVHFEVHDDENRL